ncbi:MAG: WD40 repeat domain-containing protein [Gammaproteobacteria bacterium]|nr:WD40 repeat domain-containing protein [Gammaproteobacteria bacterium]
MKRILVAGFLALASSVAAARGAGVDSYAQSLVRPAVAAHPAVASLVISAAVAANGPPVVVAATDPARVGQAYMAAAGGFIPPAGRVEEGARGTTVLLPLLDVSGDAVGTLEVGFARGSVPPAGMLEQARQVQHWFGRRVSTAGNLTDPFPYDSDARLHTRAQQLVDEVLAKHPEVLIFAIHATPPESDYNVIAGSNIGRIGKKGDNDDMRCVYTGKPNLEVNSTGKRFEVELQLHDRAGAVIGAVGIVYAYHAGVDQAALHTAADAIRAQLEPRIENAAALFETVAPRPPLVYAGRTELPGYSGDFDHFEVDPARNRLLLAAEDHGTLEVFDLHTGKHLRTIKGFDTPHSPYLVPGTSRLLLTDGSGSIKILDADSYARQGEIKTHPGADSIAVDPASGHLFVVTGGKDVHLNESWLEEIDPQTGSHIGETHFDANHVEALAIEPGGQRIYINLTDKNQLAVVDPARHEVASVWPVRAAEQNAMVQFDPVSRRVYVVTRKPGKLIAMDSSSGATLGVYDGPGWSDQELLDVANRRIYAPGGAGSIAVYALAEDGGVTPLASVASAAGAKTGILVPQLRRLFVAVSPGERKSGAAIMWFDISPMD